MSTTIREILETFEDYTLCDEYHIHGSTEPLIENTHTKEEYKKHKSFDIEAALASIAQILEEAKAKPAHSDEYSDGYNDGINGYYKNLKKGLGL